MAKKKWEAFEEECRDWLQSEFGDLAEFALMGGSNSAVSDIRARCPNGAEFYIEVKASQSQCSQFVLFPDLEAREFAYSLKNKLEMNPFTQHIVDYMNARFDEYSHPGTAGKRLDPNASEAAGHIRYQHMVKGVEFFISRNDTGFVLIPLSFIGFYFDIEAVYRRKKSGSRPVAKKEVDAVNEWLRENCGTECEPSELGYVAKKDSRLLGRTFSVGGSDYKFKEEEGEYMQLRGLANTSNPNVIFTISLKNGVEGLPKSYFRMFLRLACG